MQNVIGGLFSAIATNMHQRIGRKRCGCRRLSLGCASLLLLLALVACGLLFWVMVFQPQTAAAAYLAPDNSLAVTLLIDNSHSLFELGGQGSDPQLLRLDAAHLLISYLGVDNPQAVHAYSVIFFGSETQVVVPMTRLADDQRRQDIYHLIQNPPRMGWTDHVAALALAQSQPQAEPTGRQPAFILLTDGKPDWSNEATEAEKQAYAARLRQVSRQLTQSETPLFIILLANDATDADPDIARIWQPLWQEMAAATAPGQFYEARQAEDLVAIYHDIVVILTGGRLAPPLIQETVSANGLTETILVEENLARLTLVISKSEAGQAVTIRQPDGSLLTPVVPNVRFAGGGDAAREEIWVIDAPVGRKACSLGLVGWGSGSYLLHSPLDSPQLQPTSLQWILPPCVTKIFACGRLASDKCSRLSVGKIYKEHNSFVKFAERDINEIRLPMKNNIYGAGHEGEIKMTTNHNQMTNGNVSPMTNRLTFPDDSYQPSEDKSTQVHDTLLARMRPTLVIGLGGTGQQEVVHLKALLTGRFGQAWRRKVRLLVFDTTEEPVAVPLDDTLIQLEAGSEFFNISQVPVGSILRNLDKLDAIRERLGSTMHRLPATSLRNGAKQIRPLGLLALLWHHKKIWEQLRKAMWSLAGRDVSEAHTAVQEAGINVFILCSLAGGTGSGTFLDVAYLIRVLFAQLGDQNHSGHITGIAALPQAFYGLEGPNLLANTGAALEELNHAMVYGGFSTLYPDGRRVNVPDSPFDLLYVVDGVDEKGKTWAGGIHQVAQMVAQGVFLQMASQLGRKGENAFDNVDHVLSGQADDGFGTFLASLGLGYLVFPAQAVVDVCSRWLFLKLAREQWLKSADEQTTGQIAASRLYAVGEHQLAPELRRDPQSGGELRVDLRQPGWLADIAIDQVSASAMRFVQDYGHARLNEILLGQMDQNSRQAAERSRQDWTNWVAEMLFHPDISLYAVQAVLRQARRQLATWMADKRRQIGEQEQAFERSQTTLTQRQMAVAEAADGLFLGRRGRVREALNRYFQTAQATYQRQASLAEARGLVHVWMTLDGHLDQLMRQVQHLTERISVLQTEMDSVLPQQVQALAKAGVSRHSLADEAYVQRLWAQYAPEQVNLADLLALSMATEGDKPGLLALTELSPVNLCQTLLAGLQQPFLPLLSLSVEQVIAHQAERLSPTARREQLFRLATPSWNVDWVCLPGGGAGLERLQVLGVPDSSHSHYVDEPMLVDTHNSQELVALVVVAGAPPSALVQFDAYQREMEKAVAPLYVLPHFLAADNQAPLAFALGSIFGLVIQEGSHFYYRPSDPLEKPFRLGQGLENAIRGVAEQEWLTCEIMERIDSQIARLGFQRSIEKLTTYYTAVPKGRTQVDETMRELKRLVRDYVDELQRLNDFSQGLDQI